MLKKLYFVTSNKGKAAEAQAILHIPVEIIDIDVDEIQSLDLEQIVRLKVQEAYKKVNAPVIVDDVGLFIEAWGGFPGPFIKYLLKQGNKTILKMLEIENNRKAAVKLAIGFHDGKSIHTFVGEDKGEITKEVKGANGFGFDPIFRPEESNKTFAEMELQEKNKISHRFRALEKLKAFLEKSA